MWIFLLGGVFWRFKNDLKSYEFWLFHGYAKSSFLDVLHTRKYIIIGYKNRFFGMVLYIIRALDNATCPAEAIAAVPQAPILADANNMMQNMLAQVMMMNMGQQTLQSLTVCSSRIPLNVLLLPHRLMGPATLSVAIIQTLSRQQDTKCFNFIMIYHLNYLQL